MRPQERCPVRAYETAGEGYAGMVLEWIANPHAYFRAFGSEARAFQRRHRSTRLRIVTLVASAAELVGLRPVCLCVDCGEEKVGSWEGVFVRALSRLAAANESTFAALQEAGELAWLGCPADGTPLAEQLAAGGVNPSFASLEEVVARVQWLFLMCGIRLNEVLVQADPFTDEEWKVREASMRRKRAEARLAWEERQSRENCF